MAPKMKTVPATKAEIKIIADFLKKSKVSLATTDHWDLYGKYSDLKPWENDISIPEESVLDALEQIRKKEFEDRAKKVRETPPLEVWVMAFHTHNALGSINHVSSGDGDRCHEELDRYG